jgi:hypothetical protein
VTVDVDADHDALIVARGDRAETVAR